MKTVNFTCILSLIAAGVLLVLAAVAWVGMTVLTAMQGGIAGSIPSPSGEVGDVEGYAMIIGGLGWAFTGLGAFLLAVAALISAFFGVVLALFAGIARAVYAPQGGRLLAHRLLMALVCFIMAGVGLTLLSSGLDSRGLTVILAGLAFLADAAACAFFTFTHRVTGVLFRRAPQPDETFPPAAPPSM